MSIFGGKKKTVVSTSVVPLIGDNDFPDSSKQATFSFIMENPKINTNPNARTIGNAISDAVMNALPTKMKRSAKWVNASVSNYAYGKVTTNEITNDTVAINAYFENWLLTNYGISATINYLKFEETNNSHMSWQILKTLYGYNPTNNLLETLNAFYGVDCYLEDGEIIYCQDTLDRILDESKLNTIGLAYNYGSTLTRSEDRNRPLKVYSVSNTVLVDTFEFTFSMQQTTQQIIETNTATSVVISDTTTRTGIAPSTYESLIETVISDTTVTNMGIATRTINKTYDYICLITEDFLNYEQSGAIDETNALDDDDMENIDPNAVDSSVVTNPLNGDYFMMSFDYIVSGITYTNYFTYLFGSGGNTTLDNILNVGVELGTYFPRIYLRMYGNKLNDESLHTTTEYKTSVKLCKKMGMDYNYLCDEIHEAIGSLEHVKQIAIALHCPANPKTNEQIEYLFNYFSNLFDVLLPMSTPYKNEADEEFRTNYSSYTLKQGIKQLYTDNVYQQRFNFDAVGKKTITGVIGSIGVFAFDRQLFNSTDVIGDGSTVYAHFYRKQITSTEYVEVVAYEMGCSELVQAGYESWASRDSDNLLVPFELGISRTLSPKRREQLYGHCQMIIINTSQVIKTPWYARTWFKVFTFVIAVVLALPSGGASLSLWAVLYAVATVVLISVAVKLTIDLLVNYFGMDEKDATILANLLAIAGGKFDTKALLTYINKALTTYSDILKLEFEEVMRNMDRLDANIEEQSKMLNEAYNLLKRTQYVYDPLYTETRNNNLILGQSVSDFLTNSFAFLGFTQLAVSTPSLYTESMLLKGKV